jgi:hypothetical protein
MEGSGACKPLLTPREMIVATRRGSGIRLYFEKGLEAAIVAHSV